MVSDCRGLSRELSEYMGGAADDDPIHLALCAVKVRGLHKGAACRRFTECQFTYTVYAVRAVSLLVSCCRCCLVRWLLLLLP